MQFVVFRGDGIGPEIVEASVLTLRAAAERYGLDIEFRYEDIGLESLKAHGTTVRDEVIELAKQADGVILGPVSTKDYPSRERGGLNPSAEIRRRLDLFANIRPSRAIPGLSRLGDFDLVIVRENTEGFYADRNMALGSGEFAPTPDLALAVRKITRLASERCARAAFEVARQRGRRLTIVHKGNVLRLSDGLFVEAVYTVGREFPDIQVDEVLVDAMASLLVRDPARFDVIVTTNMFGDILSNLAAEAAGGLGLAGSLNAGDRFAVAQASHGSAPEIAGRNVANPSALILSVAMLLEWLGTRRGQGAAVEAGQALTRAVYDAAGDVAVRTPDLGGRGTTSGFAQAVAERVRR